MKKVYSLGGNNHSRIGNASQHKNQTYEMACTEGCILLCILLPRSNRQHYVPNNLYIPIATTQQRERIRAALAPLPQRW